MDARIKSGHDEESGTGTSFTARTKAAENSPSLFKLCRQFQPVFFRFDQLFLAKGGFLGE